MEEARYRALFLAMFLLMLTIGGKCSYFRGNPAHLVGRLPTASELCIAYPGTGVLDLRQHPRERIQRLEAMLAAARRVKQRDAQGNALGNMGNAYANLGEPRRHRVL